MNARLPQSLQANPGLDRWIKLTDENGRRGVRIAIGKVEMGQGILTAIAQIAAEELSVRLDDVTILSGDTDEGPDELYTNGSQSIEVSGASVRIACADARARLTTQAALRLNCAPSDLTVRAGKFLREGLDTGQSYWSAASEVDWTAPVDGIVPRKDIADYSIVGVSAPRTDLPPKLKGERTFVHDLKLPGMLHARVVRQPGRSAKLASVDEAGLRKAAGANIDIVRVHSFLALVGEDEYAVHKAAIAAPRFVTWEGARELSPEQHEARWNRDKETDERRFGAEGLPLENAVRATFSRPYLAHASLGPSCAVAEFCDGHLTIWSHGQGMHPLRLNVGRAMNIPLEQITARHVQGAGCYGHNGADDAALDAALIARERPGRPIRVLWRREDEFGYEPLSASGVVTLHAALNEKGRPADFTFEIWSGTHASRPGAGGATLLTEDALAVPPPVRKPFDVPEDRGGGATRNGLPLYDIPARRMLHHLVVPMPVRTSSLRGLGAIVNVFAIEGFMDLLAERAGEDPVAYRLSILSDLRGRRCIERVAEMANWSARWEAGSGRGLGIGFARYKNKAAYAAVIAEVEVEEEIKVTHMWSACDAGLVINPDGVANQLEGGIIQALSWTLREQVKFGADGIATIDWATYPVARFSDIPEISVEVLDVRDQASLGVGEASVGPTVAAIANAAAHALGTRFYDLPLTRERVMAALLNEGH